MADTTGAVEVAGTADGPGGSSADGPGGRPADWPEAVFAERPRFVEGVRAYGLIAMMWLRSTMAYRASFAMTAFGNFAATAFDFVAILLMFSHVDRLGGYTLPEIALLYGVSGTAFGLADLLLGSMDRLGARVRDGTLDTLLVRPVPVLAQVAADRFALRRLGRVLQGCWCWGTRWWRWTSSGRR